MKYSEVKNLIEENVVDSKPDLDLVNKTLHNLVNAGLLNKEDKERFVFKEQITWEVVYETLLYSERRFLHDIVASHIEKNKADEIESYAARLTYHYQKSENKKKIIFYSALAGKYAYSLFAIDDAIGFYRNALLNLESIKNYPKLDKSSLLEHEADIMEAISSFPEAISLYNTSLDVFDCTIKSRRSFLPWKVDLKKRMAQLNHKLSVVYERSLDYDNAIYYLDRAYDSLSSRPGLLTTKINATRGVVHFRKKEFDDALKYSKKSLDSATKRKSLSDMGYAYNIIANVYKTTGKLHKSVDYFKKAIDKYDKGNNISGIAMSSFNLAVTLTHLSELQEADKYYEKSVAINKKMQNKLALMQDYFMRANTKLNLRDYTKAMDYYTNAIEIYDNGLKREDIYGVCLARIAEIHSENNAIEKAEDYITRSLSILTNLKHSPDSLGQAKFILIQLRMKQERYSEAESICNELIDVFHELKAASFELFAMRLMGMIYRDTGQYSMAKDILKKAYDLATDMNSSYMQKCVQNLIFDVAVRSGDYQKDMIDKVETLLSLFKEKNDYFEIDIAKNVIQNIQNN